MAEIAANAIRDARYTLRTNGDDDNAVHLLMGLAIVASSTRSTDLAREIRVLSRVLRRSRAKIEATSYLRVAMISAVAHEENAAWRDEVGNWVTELSFAEMTKDEARKLKSHLATLLRLEPSLWQSCSRAEAALASM
ncbi:hypothetical protein [Rhizobium sullae]|uniref:hypothetical protein n=1 Tax=Rhizobium sullae TaxID=50338 RepID=UPI000B34DBA5|nr:hypothetical protein [Rhizobium sullae]